MARSFLDRKDDALIATFYYSPESKHLICCRVSELNTYVQDSETGITVRRRTLRPTAALSLAT